MLAKAQRKNSHILSRLSCGVVIMENSFTEQQEIKLPCAPGIQGLGVYPKELEPAR